MTNSTYRTLEVIRLEQECVDVVSVYLADPKAEPLPDYQPGQHLHVRIQHPTLPSPCHRFYTLSDIPNGRDYRLTIKRETGDGRVSQFLHDRLAVGDRLDVQGPKGNFVINVDDTHPIILIAGGIGITPLYTMLRAIVERGTPRTTHLFYGARDRAHQAFHDALQGLAERAPFLSLHPFYSRIAPHDRPCRRMTARDILDVLPAERSECFLCGPDQMMQELRADLIAGGVPSDHVRTESFCVPASSEPSTPAAAGSQIVFQRSGVTATWTDSFRTLWECADAHGVEIDSGCLCGDCGTCMTPLLSGDVRYHHPTVAKPDPGTCLVCSCRPEGPIVLDA